MHVHMYTCNYTEMYMLYSRNTKSCVDTCRSYNVGSIKYATVTYMYTHVPSLSCIRRQMHTENSLVILVSKKNAQFHMRLQGQANELRERGH